MIRLASIAVVVLMMSMAAPTRGACPEMTVFNISIVWSAPNGCSPQTSCGQGQAIAFDVVTTGYDFTCAQHRFTWDFGDGAPISNEMRPVHHFPPLSGTQSYIVRLTVMNDHGILILAKTILFQSSPGSTTLPRIIYFLADPSRAMRGEQVTLGWNVDNSYLIQIEPIGYQVNGMGAGSYPFVPTGTATYTLTAVGTAASESQSLDVEVVDAPCATMPPAIAIDWVGQASGCTRANTQPCKAGETVLFSIQPFGSTIPFCFHRYAWTFSGGGTATRQNSPYAFPAPGPQNVHLTVRNAAGSAEDSASLNVATTTSNTIAYFLVTPSVVTRGSSVVLQWSARNTSQLVIEPLNLRTNDLDGSYAFAPAASTTYTMTALGEAETAVATAATAQVTVIDPLPRRRPVRH